jgi:phospholipase C
MAARAVNIIAGAGFAQASFANDGGAEQTATPIEHLVVIFQENVSFDHYFATYPVALNPSGEPSFKRATIRRRSTGSARWSTAYPTGSC